MTSQTKAEISNLIFYSIYVRAHGATGKFADVEADLQRIKNLGVDVIWLMPIHPIGKLKAKGSMGCPYSISDYRAVNPEYGSLRDFERLTAKAHQIGLKVIIDVVYHHTAHDSNLISEHPEWYRQDAAGKPRTSVPEWSDIIDLNHPNAELTEYLVESLAFWVERGVDGFRCDVASCIPIEFWKYAHAHLQSINPNLIWLAESVHSNFLIDRRRAGLIAHSDAELYEAFDITYDYDVWDGWKAAVKGSLPIERYLELLIMQDSIYPANYCKLRSVENHDQKRIMAQAKSKNQALAWTAFQAFNKGPFMIYAGQESGATHTPSLFEREPIEWRNYELAAFIETLIRIKKERTAQSGQFSILEAKDCIQAIWQFEEECLYGIFNVNDETGSLAVQLDDGEYDDLLNDQKIIVRQNLVAAPKTASILRTKSQKTFQLFSPAYWKHN